MSSNDSGFRSEAADIIGLYLNPPKHAAVFCVDEKTAIQALDRLDAVLPLSPGWLRRAMDSNTTGMELRRYINAYSANAQPIQWKYSGPSRRIRSNEFSATGH